MTDTSSQTGLDGRSDARVAILGLGYVGHASNDRLRAALAGRLSVVDLPGAHLAAADVIVVSVPTPITRSKDPDLGPIVSPAAPPSRPHRAQALPLDPAKRSFQASRPCTCPAIHERIAPLPCCARE